jgi:hypothetical protein
VHRGFSFRKNIFCHMRLCPLEGRAPSRPVCGHDKAWPSTKPTPMCFGGGTRFACLPKSLPTLRTAQQASRRRQVASAFRPRSFRPR